MLLRDNSPKLQVIQAKHTQKRELWPLVAPRTKVSSSPTEQKNYDWNLNTETFSEMKGPFSRKIHLPSPKAFQSKQTSAYQPVPLNPLKFTPNSGLRRQIRASPFVSLPVNFAIEGFLFSKASAIVLAPTYVRQQALAW